MPSVYRFGRFELRPAQRTLLLDGEAQRLGGRAFDILLALVERRERIVDIDELLDLVWDGLAVEENNLSVQISALRKLVGAEAITTVRGRGYRFTQPTHAVAAPDDAAAARPGLWQRPGAVLAISVAGAPAGGTSWFERLGLGAHFGEPGPESAGGLAGRVLAHRGDLLCIALERTGDGARVALRAQRLCSHAAAAADVLQRGHARVGLVAADLASPHTSVLQEAADLAQSLADAAGPDEIVVTADVVGEFVAGLDGEVEDVGDLRTPAGNVRAYRVRLPSTPVIAPGTFAEAMPHKTDVRPCIAVLPFDGLPGTDPDDLLGEALADDVITFLSRSPEFSVISGLSSRRLKRCGLSATHVAGCLSADYLLMGSCRVAAGRIVLSVQLQDTRRGGVIRSLQMESGLREAFEPADPLGHRVGLEVGHALFSHAVQQSKLRPLPDLENYALLMGAIGLMHRAAAREFERARAMLEHLSQRPGCAGIAAAWLAKWHVLRVVQGWSVNSEADSQAALDLVARSLDEDSRDTLALSIGGLVHAYLRKDLQVAGRMYQAAIDANPSEPLAWLFTATRHAYLGEGTQAEAAGEQALRLSPIDPMKYFFDSLAATAVLANASWERSVELSLRSIKANRTHSSTWRTLAFALVMLDRMDEARDAVQHLLEVEPGLTVGRFRERFPGRDGPLAEPWAEALKVAGLPA